MNIKHWLRQDELDFVDEPMTEAEAKEYGPQWGSYIRAADPGAIMYSAIPPETSEHRDAMVTYIREKLYPMALEGDNGPEEGLEDEFEWNDSAMLRRLVVYLLQLQY